MTQEELHVIFEDYLLSLPFGETPKRLYEPIRYAMDGGGKRIRPLLLLSSFNMFSDNIAAALPAAAAVEIFHNFTLVHDDIMDNAPLRRGRETVYKKWNTNRAILSGDAMMIYSYTLLESCPAQVLPQVLYHFNRMGIEVCEGQQFDMNFEQRDEVELEKYIRMIELKTASLIAHSIAIGAILGGASKADMKALYRYGVELGIAFQLQDDFLDSYGTTESLGKNIGGDILEGKKTFLLINALKMADDRQRQELLDVLKDNSLDPQKKIEKVLDAYNNLGIKELTQKAIHYHTDRAIDFLKGVAIKDNSKSLFVEIAQMLVKRER